MGTKEFLGQKLPYMTNPQKKYLENIQIPLDGYRNLVQEELKNLERPEASWTLTDLIASGAQFPSTFMGKTTYIDPDNTFLVGYKAFINLRSAYRFMAEHAQTALNDTALCKECLYLTAYCLKCLCGWPLEDKNRVTKDGVSLAQMPTFLNAVIADAPDDFIAELGTRLMMPERNWDKITTARGKATVFLAAGRYEEAYQYAEQLQAIADRRKKPLYFWRHYAQGIKAIIDHDEEFLNIILPDLVSRYRVGPPEVPYMMAYPALGLAKLAVKNGLQVTIDTMDCPQALIRPAQMDYSRLDLPRPKYGFPWEKKTGG